jgi:hypothetical protein
MCGLAIESAVANLATLALCITGLISCTYVVTKLCHSSIVIIVGAETTSSSSSPSEGILQHKELLLHVESIST